MAVPSICPPVVEDDTSISEPPDASLKKPNIDFEDLLLAFEGFGSAEMEHYLDTENGEVIPLHDDFEDAGEIRERIDAGFPDRD